MTVAVDTSGIRVNPDEAPSLLEQNRLSRVGAARSITSRELAAFARPFDEAQLRYLDGDRTASIPDWVHFFTALGVATADRSSARGVPVTAVSTPAAGFAAAFVALGAVAQGSWRRGEFSAHEHFLALCQTPAGSPATYQNGRTMFRGVLAQSSEIDGMPVVGIRIDRSNVRWLPESQCARIQLSAEADGFAVPEHGHGKVLSIASVFVSAALNGGDAVRHASADSTDALIVGVLQRLESECVPENFAVTRGVGSVLFTGPQAGSKTGSLQSVLRVRRLLQGGGQHYRSQFLPSIASDPGRLSELRGVPVILDGARAFLRWRQTWRGAPTVVILDRADTGSSEAGEAFSQEYEMDRLDDEDPMAGLPTPTGVERLSFWRRARS